MSSHPEPDPEAESTHSAVQSSDSVARRSHRSCFLCNRRKVRCDKREPCGPCSRAGKQCVYPPPGEPIRRPRKTTMADVASRISHLEQSLVSSRNGDTPSSHQSATSAKPALHAANATATTPYVSSSSSNTPKRADSVAGDGVLLQRGSTSQYFNEILLSRVIEEERDIQSVFTSPESRPPPLALSSPFNPMGVLSAPSSSHTPASFYPPKQAAHRLWNLYVDYVECCSGLKMGHVPSMEVKIFTTLEDPAAAPLEDLALNYAVFFATLVSREDEEVVAILGGSRTAWLKQTKMGFEQALAHADFLDKPTATGLHAMAVYLSALTVHNRGKGIWILNGLAIRMAQSIGIHCNGERLGLSPFESELRRRLWWHFMNRDGRAGEDYGLQNTMNPVQSADIQMPLNVEDTDLYPEMTELPPPRKAFTAMTLSLNQIDIATASYRLTTLAASPTLPPDEVRQQIINEMKTSVEERLKFCNNFVPRQRHTICISRYVMRKIDLITRQQWASLRCPGTREACATEEDLVDAVETLEDGMSWVNDELLRPFMWAAKAYPQYNLMMYVLWHLCVRPEGPTVDRAWRVVNTVAESQMWDNMREGVGTKGAVLDALYGKAKALREKKPPSDETTQAQAQAQDGEPVQQAAPVADGDFGFSLNSWPYAFGNTEGDGFDAVGEDGFPDWGSLVRGLQMNGQNFSETMWH